MNTTILLIIGGCSIFLLGLLIIYLVIAGRNKKQKHLRLEMLIDGISLREADRKAWLINFLVDRYAQQEQIAIELCEDFIAAEKQFLHAYMEQQLSKQPSTDFYDHICQLLDTYLELLPVAAIVESEVIDQQLTEVEQASAIKSEQLTEQQQTETEVNSISAPDSEADDFNIADDEDKFSEENNVVQESSEQINEVIAGQEQQDIKSSPGKPDQQKAIVDDIPEDSSEALSVTSKQETDSDLHPDWGAAFDEADVEMKEPSEKKA